jgi:hypothetical protein
MACTADRRLTLDQTVLLYDAKCPICRNLALKVRTHARKPLEIVALSDPEASRMLKPFYPQGWTHEFYLLENESCRKGLAAIPKLVGLLGPKQFGSLIAEYGTYRISKGTCSTKKHDHGKAPADGNGNGNGHGATHGEGATRRRMLAYAAAAPLLALAKVPQLTDPFAGSSKKLPEIGINLAVVWRNSDGSFKTEVRPAPASAFRAGPDFGTSKSNNKKITGREQQILEQSAGFGDRAHGVAAESVGPQFVLRREHMDVEGPGGEARFMDTFAYAADYGRYSVTLNVGHGTVGSRNRTVVASTLSGMIRHDLPIPLVDVVSFIGTADAATHFDAYVEGVKALRRFHADAGRDRVSTVYESIEDGLRNAATVYRRNVTEEHEPVKSKIVITSMPELMQFVDVKPELGRMRGRIASSGAAPMVVQAEEVSGGCDCTCSCECCCGCGCGCGCGLCGCMCICECCCSCGCGCGCGCCAGGAEALA